MRAGVVILSGTGNSCREVRKRDGALGGGLLQQVPGRVVGHPAAGAGVGVLLGGDLADAAPGCHDTRVIPIDRGLRTGQTLWCHAQAKIRVVTIARSARTQCRGNRPR
jgi:hypothetical protein